MNPVFDAAHPWVAIIQLSLTYLLPRLTGLVTDRLANPVAKMLTLGVLTLAASAGNFALGYAVADTWSQFDWTAFLNLLVNAAITYALAQGVYRGVIVPSGQAAKDAVRGVSIIPADKERVADEKAALAVAQVDTIAERNATVEKLVDAKVAAALSEIPIATLAPEPEPTPSPAKGTSRSKAATSSAAKAAAVNKPTAKK